MFFVVPSQWKKFHHIDESGKKIARVSTSCWFTNLEVKKHNDDLILFKTYRWVQRILARKEMPEKKYVVDENMIDVDLNKFYKRKQ